MSVIGAIITVRAPALQFFAPSARAPGGVDAVVVEVRAEPERVLGRVAPAADPLDQLGPEFLVALAPHQQRARPGLALDGDGGAVEGGTRRTHGPRAHHRRRPRTAAAQR